MEEPKCKICGDTGRAKPTLSEPDGEECECTKEPSIMECEPLIMRPCPFCGSQPIEKEIKWLNIKCSSVRCENDACLVQPCTGTGDRERMIEIWNQRAISHNARRLHEGR